jgi:hypothetical protein
MCVSAQNSFNVQKRKRKRLPFDDRVRTDAGGTCKSKHHRISSKPMDELELTHWLEALVETRRIEGWRLKFGPEESTISCVIDGRQYSHEAAVKLVRDFEVGAKAA